VTHGSKATGSVCDGQAEPAKKGGRQDQLAILARGAGVTAKGNLSTAELGLVYPGMRTMPACPNHK